MGASHIRTQPNQRERRIVGVAVAVAVRERTNLHAETVEDTSYTAGGSSVDFELRVPSASLAAAVAYTVEVFR